MHCLNQIQSFICTHKYYTVPWNCTPALKEVISCVTEIDRKEKRTKVTKNFDVEKQKKQNRENMIDEPGSAQVIELQKRLQGVNRRVQPGEPMPSKS